MLGWKEILTTITWLLLAVVLFLAPMLLACWIMNWLVSLPYLILPRYVWTSQFVVRVFIWVWIWIWIWSCISASWIWCGISNSISHLYSRSRTRGPDFRGMTWGAVVFCSVFVLCEGFWCIISMDSDVALRIVLRISPFVFRFAFRHVLCLMSSCLDSGVPICLVSCRVVS